MMRSTWTIGVSGGALFTILLVQSTATQRQPTQKVSGDPSGVRYAQTGLGSSRARV